MMQNPRAGDAATQAATMASGIMDNSPVAPPSEQPAAGSISLPGLLASFLKIGVLGFGGGMAVIALMERELIRKRRLLPADQFLSGVGLGQILGSFAANASFFVGYRLYGLAGAVLSVMVFLLPSLAAVIALSDLYFHYQCPGAPGGGGGTGAGGHRSDSERGLVAGTPGGADPAGRRIRGSPGGRHPEGQHGLGTAVRRGSGFPAPGISPGRRRPSAVPGGTFRWPSCPGRNAGRAGPIAATFFKIGLVFFGGGFALLPVLNERLVNGLHWLTAANSWTAWRSAT